ncbi:MAG: FtsX-like permease family protein [Fulvivirga sp.]|uniref:FtsX-like permease family protein n=1 Tax=Fulvivirga sp. TaxID=1931237 RepID=UPI0032F06324
MAPPKLAQKLLCWFLKDDLAEEVLGDLEEKYIKTTTAHSKVKATINYWYQVINYLRPFALKKYRSNSNYINMQQHNFKISIRNFQRNKSAFLINVIGLTTGLASALFIYLWVNHELSVNAFHANSENIHHALINHEEDHTLRTTQDTPGLLAEALQNEISEVVRATEDTDPLWFGESFALSSGNEFMKGLGKFSGAQFFEILSYPLVEGNAQKVLADKKSIAISESMAIRLFGKVTGAVGETVTWRLLHFEQEAIISAVFEDVPGNSTDQFDFVLPYQVFKEMNGAGINWLNFNAYTVVELAPGTDVEQLNQRLKPFIKEKSAKSNVSPMLYPYTDWYLKGNFENGVAVGGRIQYVQLLSIVAVFLLLIAVINFVNLTTARSSKRMKEIGVKKSLGAVRSSLIAQFITEAILLSAVSMVLATLLVKVLSPQFSHIIGKHLYLELTPTLLLPLFCTTVFIGILAGSYPALYLSKLKPIHIFKNKIKTGFAEILTRKGLVVFQFIISIVMITSVIIISDQIQFINNKNLGYNRSGVIMLPLEGETVKKMDTFFDQVAQVPGVMGASASSHAFVKKSGFTTGVSWPGKDQNVVTNFGFARVYDDMFETLEIEMIEGRVFSKEHANEKSKIIFNEEAIDVMGLENPIGTQVIFWGEEREIVGIVKNFHFSSLHDAVQPTAIIYDDEFMSHAFIKINASDMSETLSRLDSFYRDFNPEYTFNYEFMDGKFKQQYQAENQVASISVYFAAIAIIISCLGLFGLASFNAEVRRKEIGIRKVLGASSAKIISLLTGEYMKTVALALIIAIPLSYYTGQYLLADYAYAVKINIWYFLLAAGLSLVITYLTIGLQTLKSASINPVDCLKNE